MIENKEIDMATNDEISRKVVGSIWNWWNAKPQKRKNDATVRIITRTDIVELVNILKEVMTWQE